VSRRLTVESVILYSEGRFLASGISLSAKSRDLWVATLSGLIVSGVLASVLSIPDIPFSTGIGALVGGVVAAYVLYGKVNQAVTAGALAGILGTPFFLGVSQIFLIFGLIPIPSGPNPPLSQLQTEVVFIFMINLVAGVIGGALGGTIRHRKPEMEQPTTVALPSAAPTQVRYCVQCGAQLPSGAVICPHCNARQPQ